MRCESLGRYSFGQCLLFHCLCEKHNHTFLCIVEKSLSWFSWGLFLASKSCNMRITRLGNFAILLLIVIIQLSRLHKKESWVWCHLVATNGSDRILLNEKAKSLTYRLKSKGLKMHPWRTPLAYWKDRVWLFPILTEEVELEYKLLITLLIEVSSDIDF